MALAYRAIIKTREKSSSYLTFLLNLLVSLHANVSLCVVAHHHAIGKVGKYQQSKQNSLQSRIMEADQ